PAITTFLTMTGGGGSLRPRLAAAISAASQAVEQFGETRPECMTKPGTRGFDYQRLRPAMQGRNDDLFYGMEHLFVLLHDLLETRGERPDHAIGKQNAEKGSDKRGADHTAKDGWGL